MKSVKRVERDIWAVENVYSVMARLNNYLGVGRCRDAGKLETADTPLFVVSFVDCFAYFCGGMVRSLSLIVVYSVG
jgi:hypothetical protein